MLYYINELKSNFSDNVSKDKFNTKNNRFSSYKEIIFDIYAENQQVEDMFDDMNKYITE